jgi:hypothetical protein
MKRAVYSTTLVVLTVASTALGQVVPSGLENSSGDSNLNLLIGFQRPSRFQQVYQGTALDTGNIQEIRFRQDEEFGGGASCTLTNVTVVLSSTTVSPDALSLTFADNHGADATTVFSGNLVISSASTTADPRPFDYVIRLTTQFYFDATAGKNLLLDITAPVGDGTYPCDSDPTLDSQFDFGDSVSLVYCFSGSCSPTFDSASAAGTDGFVTLFLRDDNIFSDGFESGDTLTWTSTVP